MSMESLNNGIIGLFICLLNNRFLSKKAHEENGRKIIKHDFEVILDKIIPTKKIPWYLKVVILQGFIAIVTSILLWIYRDLNVLVENIWLVLMSMISYSIVIYGNIKFREFSNWIEEERKLADDSAWEESNIRVMKLLTNRVYILVWFTIHQWYTWSFLITRSSGDLIWKATFYELWGLSFDAVCSFGPLWIISMYLISKQEYKLNYYDKHLGLKKIRDLYLNMTVIGSIAVLSGAIFFTYNGVTLVDVFWILFVSFGLLLIWVVPAYHLHMLFNNRKDRILKNICERLDKTEVLKDDFRYIDENSSPKSLYYLSLLLTHGKIESIWGWPVDLRGFFPLLPTVITLLRYLQ